MTISDPIVTMDGITALQVSVQHVSGVTVTFPQGVNVGDLMSSTQAEVDAAMQAFIDLFDGHPDWSVTGAPVKIGSAYQEITPTVVEPAPIEP